MCPDCKEPLVVFELEGVEIDHCLACGGTWLDPGELELLAELEGLQSSEIVKALDAAVSGKKSRRRCPRCRFKLRAVTLNRIELDRCPRCHGLWMDRGEIREVISSCCKEEGEARMVGRFFAELYKNALESNSSKPEGG
jgi:Zn-finger nucleic acid-binding protein